LVRGGHLDLCVLGAFQVAENGDLANWARSEDDNAPAIGGAMDLAAGARRIWIVMEHNTRSGEARLLRRCTYPLTAAACVKRVYTELAVIDVTPRGFAVVDMVPGLSLEELQTRTDAPLVPAAGAKAAPRRSSAGGEGSHGTSSRGYFFTGLSNG